MATGRTRQQLAGKVVPRAASVERATRVAVTPEHGRTGAPLRLPAGARWAHNPASWPPLSHADAVRPLEIVFLASLVLCGVSLFIAPARRPAALRYRPFVPITLAVLHVFFDHGRWQLVPAYAAAALLALAAVVGMRRSPQPRAADDPFTDDASRPHAAADVEERPELAGSTAPAVPGWMRRVSGLFVLLLAGGSAAIATLVLLFALPAPSGPHRVGTRWLILTDSTRDEDLSPEPGDKRTLVVRLWFPADSVAGNPDPYIEREVAAAMARALGLPGFALSHLVNVETHAHRRAWLSSSPARLPLILFSHGYAVGTESQNSVQMEELASHGFVVASIDHPYEAAAIVVRAGKVLAARPRLAVGDSATMARSVDLARRLQAARDTAAVAAVLPDMYALTAPLDTSIAQWVLDTRFVLDALTRMSRAGTGADTLLPGRLDTDRVGLFGMSFGGATAAGVCAADTRCAAGINLDGLLYGDAAHTPLSRPFLFASAEESRQLHRIFHERATGASWLLTVRGAKHLDFTDLNWFAPALGARIGLLGGIAPPRMHALLNAVVVPWFDAALRQGAAFDSAALVARFPELSVERRPGGALPAPSTARDASAPAVVPVPAGVTSR
jgi:hypothetical protein